MDANPVLVELTRGDWVENRHCAALVVRDGKGQIVARVGDTARPIFPRSAVKSMQALAMATSGAIDRFELSDTELALACASHQGEPEHIEGVGHFLAHLGLSTDNLECGAHPPTAPAARETMRARHEEPTALCNNCSGKHSGLLATSLALGVPTRGYVERQHPTQVAVREAIEMVIGEKLSTDLVGTDGCSIPTWAAPLDAFALGFARMATGEGLPSDIAAAAHRIFDAATSHPFLVAGSAHIDSEAMEAFGGRLMLKGGAEGVYCGAIRDKGLGFALKIDDGNQAASRALVAALLLEIADPDEAQTALLERYATQTVKNVRKLEVGALAARRDVVKAGFARG
ncbi:MAG TPA: asparaginase [Devosiaceae bacterium]|nr:asparaginase [Devosiaceae bacterium]